MACQRFLFAPFHLLLRRDIPAVSLGFGIFWKTGVFLESWERGGEGATFQKSEKKVAKSFISPSPDRLLAHAGNSPPSTGRTALGIRPLSAAHARCSTKAFPVRCSSAMPDPPSWIKEGVSKPRNLHPFNKKSRVLMRPSLSNSSGWCVGSARAPPAQAGTTPCCARCRPTSPPSCATSGTRTSAGRTSCGPPPARRWRPSAVPSDSR